MSQLLQKLESYERKLHDPKYRRDISCLNEYLHPDFFEFGSSGNQWSRQQVVDRLLIEPSNHIIESFDYNLLSLSPTSVLLTYKTKKANRSSIWIYSNGKWQMIFHQGTLHP